MANTNTEAHERAIAAGAHRIVNIDQDECPRCGSQRMEDQRGPASTWCGCYDHDEITWDGVTDDTAAWQAAVDAVRSPLDEIERLERELHDVKVAYHELRTLVLAIKDLVA